jgi:hypothetical protein
VPAGKSLQIPGAVAAAENSQYGQQQQQLLGDSSPPGTCGPQEATAESRSDQQAPRA